MANVYDFLGAQKDYFQKASWQVYCDASGRMQYVGKVNAEIEVDMGIENIEYFDNENGVQVLFVLTQTKVDPKINFSWMQIFDPGVVPITFNLEKDDSDANVTRDFIGSDPDDYEYHGWRFVSKSLGGQVCTLYVRQGVCSSNGTWTSGGAGALATLPATVRMTQDTTIANGKRDLGYFEFDKRALS